MHTEDLSPWNHHHQFAEEFSSAEKNTRRVLVLTALMMVVEIIGGLKFHSLALFADGWHMGTHVAAFAISALAYWFSRRYAGDEHFSFGTGKIGVLGAFTSAIILGGIAFYMAGESLVRLFHPLPISFNEAIPIACLGLAVNVLSAVLLKHNHSHEPHSHHSHEKGHAHEGDDLNLKAAYIHVLADAVTSVLAITALSLGKAFGWLWLDPFMGLIGGAVIAQWAYTLVRDTVVILLDCKPETCDLDFEIHKALESDEETRIADLHIWQVGVNRFSAIVALVTHDPKEPQYYKQLLAGHEELVHVTIEVNLCRSELASAV